MTGVTVSDGNFSGTSLTIGAYLVGTRKKSIDSLNLSGVQALFAHGASSITSSYSYDSRRKSRYVETVVTLSGSITASEIQTFLRGIRFSTSGKGLTKPNRTINVALSGPEISTSSFEQNVNVYSR